MKSNIIETNKGTVIINGGNPLNDCPTNWDEAKKWQEDANKESSGNWEGPEWEWDCGFKLDYDGPILRISSRFYPPKTHYGKTWDGTVTVYCLDKEIEKKKFDCDTLDELRGQVKKYISGLCNKIKKV